MTGDQALSAIRELQESRGLVPEFELAARCREILNRSGLRQIDLTEYLLEKGLCGARLARVMGPFASAVKAAYIREHDVAPVKSQILVDGQVRMANVYLEVDRPLLDEAFEASL